MAKASCANALHPAPSLKQRTKLNVSVARSAPPSVTAIGVPVGTKGAVPRDVGFDRDALAAAGFEGKLGQTFVLPHGKSSIVVAVGVGDAKLSVAPLRDADAACARAASRHEGLATTLADATTGISPRDASEAVVEGGLLTWYRYEILKSAPSDIRLRKLTRVTSADRIKAQSDRRDRKQLDSQMAHMRNLGDAQTGSITAALYLEEFVDGIAWTHFDICGTMKSDADDSWRSRGATGVEARLFADLVVSFKRPDSAA